MVIVRFPCAANNGIHVVFLKFTTTLLHPFFFLLGCWKYWKYRRKKKSPTHSLSTRFPLGNRINGKYDTIHFIRSPSFLNILLVVKSETSYFSSTVVVVHVFEHPTKVGPSANKDLPSMASFTRRRTPASWWPPRCGTWARLGCPRWRARHCCPRSKRECLQKRSLWGHPPFDNRYVSLTLYSQVDKSAHLWLGADLTLVDAGVPRHGVPNVCRGKYSYDEVTCAALLY